MASMDVLVCYHCQPVQVGFSAMLGTGERVNQPYCPGQPWVGYAP
jgi:hypothetical protein